MTILRAYFDDSNDPQNLSHGVFVLGGYVTAIDEWDGFVSVWNAALKEWEVPYFHLKEFGNMDGIYKHIKNDSEKETRFLSGLIEIIKSHVQFCPVSAIRMDDLRAFNMRHSLSIDPYALAVYGCIIELRRKYRDDDIEVVFDRFDKSESRVLMGMEYAKTDSAGDLKVSRLTHVPLRKDETFRNVLPLQAADFVSGEVRKFLEERKTWKPPRSNDRTPRQTEMSYWQWWGEQYVERGAPARERKSYIALMEQSALAPSGYLWDEVLLEAALARHPNGWGSA